MSPKFIEVGEGRRGIRRWVIGKDGSFGANAEGSFLSALWFKLLWLLMSLYLFHWSIVDLQCCVIFRYTAKWFILYQFSSVQSLSRVRLFATPWITARQASLSITNSRSSLRLTSIESVMPSNHLILCRPLLLLPPIPPSMSLFQWIKSLHEVANVLEFQL